MPSYGRALHQASVVLAQVPGGVNKQGSTLSGKWRSLAGLLPGGGLKAGPPTDPPRPSIISLFHSPGVGPAQVCFRNPDVREEASYGCSMVLAYGQVFTLEASEARAPHSRYTSNWTHDMYSRARHATEAGSRTAHSVKGPPTAHRALG